MIPPFYTVVGNSEPTYSASRFWIRYVLPPHWTVQEFPDTDGFADPGEATREFKKYQRFQQAEYMSKSQFERRIQEHQQDLEKLRSWTSGEHPNTVQTHVIYHTRGTQG